MPGPLAAEAVVLLSRWRSLAPYHGVMQDFGFSNLGFAALFTAAAIEPGSSERFVAIALGVYVVHGVTHVLRYYELYCGGGVPLNSRPQVLELRDGLELLAAATGLALLADALSRHSWPTPGVGAVRVASCRGRVVA